MSDKAMSLPVFCFFRSKEGSYAAVMNQITTDGWWWRVNELMVNNTHKSGKAEGDDGDDYGVAVNDVAYT